MLASKGVLTQLGGRTSPRRAGRPPVRHPDHLRLRRRARSTTRRARSPSIGVTVKEGDIISIDGTLGEVYDVALDTEPATVTGDFGTFMAWADEFRKLGVRANADTPEQADAGRRARRAKASASAAPSTCSSATACRWCRT